MRTNPGELTFPLLMVRYQVRLTGNDGHVRASEEFEARDDATAVRVARHLFAERPRYHGFELWQGKRVVHRVLGRPVMQAERPR